MTAPRKDFGRRPIKNVPKVSLGKIANLARSAARTVVVSTASITTAHVFAPQAGAVNIVTNVPKITMVQTVPNVNLVMNIKLAMTVFPATALAYAP